MLHRRLPLAAVLLALACSRPAPGPAPEPVVEEVGPALDAELSLDGEETARRRRETVAGVLPGDFPAGLPVPPRASVVELGAAEGGAGTSYVVLFSPDSPERVRSRWRAELAAAGWQLDGGGEQWTLSRGGRSARAALRPASPGTEIRIDYRAGG